MTQDEQDLLQATSEAIMQLARDRDDTLAGFMAVILDLYGVEFREGRQTKEEALFRLQIQRDFLAKHRKGVKFLDALIQRLEMLQLQPAKPSDSRQLRLMQ